METMFKLREATKESPRDRAIIETLFYTGVRVSELINILLEDIRWNGHQIWIRNGKGNKERFVLFTSDCGARITRYLDLRADNSPYLFVTRLGKPFTRQGIHKIIKMYAEKANINQNVTAHSFRHTFATELALRGFPYEYISELLGHKNLNNARIYTKLISSIKKR
ncbi:tyrosine-type recombinase/integrase [Desulforamulus aeronauticus]|uniref:Phage integrase family protein n=1 Tax=Desulforamulus aeronauticus DSM 10349 TaxID=1121421 RepID=A0A1M6UY59_9FIRM|nr:tyrosine-type recombinase/integrase [Desulforamulus aeronauticus]SHK74130.1 Phage integrase family protein [Desulforamulus aeronauticus DSM 10349]